jgi:WD40 repeat protein
VFGVGFSPDGRRLATGRGDPTVKVWDLAAGKVCLTLKGHQQRVLSVAFSPDGKLIASAGTFLPGMRGGSWRGEAKVWDAATGRERLALAGGTTSRRLPPWPSAPTASGWPPPTATAR